MNVEVTKILNAISTMNTDELRSFNEAVCAAIKSKKLMEDLKQSMGFKIGDRVLFKQGKRNPRYVTILVNKIHNGCLYGREEGGYMDWRVSANLVSKV